MKISQIVRGLVTITALPSIIMASSGKGKPGYCDSEKDCTKKAAGYTCVSVQTTRENVEYVKQCLPTSQPVCTGTQPGLCPSFSNTWGSEFRQISSVCAYILPEGKTKCMKRGETGKKGFVECIFVKDNEDESNKEIGVIYGCVDFDGSRLLFKKNEKSDKLARQFNYTGIISGGCVNPKNPSGASFVCSSQGTCGPKTPGQLDYECKCNVGFQGKFCEKLVNNKCYNDGVCGGGVCDLTTQECTKCKPGTKGNKCSECDPTYENVCSGKGECVASDGTSTLGASDTNTSTTGGKNQCKCNDGWTDVACNVKVAGKQPETEGNPDETPAAASTGITNTMASLTIFATTVIVSLL